MKKVMPWTSDIEEFKLFLTDDEYVVFRNPDGSLWLGTSDSDPMGCRVVASFMTGKSPLHTTDRLRQFCNRFHPEIDFDAEFETGEPGVFALYHEKFGYDSEEWAAQQVYEELVGALKAKGYELEFPEGRAEAQG